VSIQACCSNANPPTLGAFGDSVFERVLDYRLQNEAGYLRAQQFGRDLRVNLQAVAKAYLLNCQVLLQQIELFVQRHLLPG
jgi:hypothetical protein